MESILKSLRLLAEPSRTRIVLLLEREELSVAELQEILGMGQSTISTYLSQLKQASLVEDRRTGKNILYVVKPGVSAEMLAVLRHAGTEIPEAADDAEALKLVLARRQDRMRSYFDELAGKFGRQYVPGRSWQGLAETLLTARDGRALRRALSDTSRPGTFSPAELDAYARDWTAPGTMTAMLAWYRALVRLPRRHPPRVRMPVLILWGRKDHALQSGLAEASLNLCDRGRIVWFPRATHWVQHEEADTVNAELKAFFASGKTVDQAD